LNWYRFQRKTSFYCSSAFAEEVENLKYFLQQLPSVIALVDYKRCVHLNHQRRLMPPPT